MTGGRWAASSCTALVVLGDGVSRHGFSDPRWDAERLFAHERVHVIQSDFAFLTWSDPVEAWLAGRTGTGCAIYRHLAILQVHVNLDELAPYRLRVSAQLQPGAGADGIPRPVSADLLDLGAMVLEPRNTAPDGTRWYDERWLDPEDVDLEALHLRAPSEPPDMESWQLRLRSAGAMQLLWSSEGAPPNTFHIPTVWLDWVEVEEIEADLTTYQRWSASSPGGEYRLHLFTVSRAGWTLRWERAGASARL